MNKAVYPGSFDPFTNGHLDIAQRSALIFDELIVAVLVNEEKKSMFSMEERVAMASEATRHIPNVKVRSFDGLLVDFMRSEQSRVILRGVRALTDFEYEFQLAQMNKQLAPEIETFFVVTDAKYAYLSSRGVKDVFHWGGMIQEFVPPGVFKRMRERD